MTRLLPTVLFALLALGSSGCVGASLAEKRASFEPFEQVLIKGEGIERYLTARTAMLLRDFDVAVARERDQHVLRLSPTAGDRQGFGTAVAISHDGYFLTAAHNLQGNVIHLLLRSAEGRLKIGTARAVWSGDPDDPAQDFAILKLDVITPSCFQWADPATVHPGTTLVTAGCAAPLAPPVLSAGAALETIPAPASQDGLPPTSLVIHDAPVRKGDSGGPLTTLDGRLVALNVIYAPLTGRHQSVRPDPEWVTWVIGVDRLRRRRAQARAPVATLPRPQ